jgi:hypothetical protein
VHQAATWAWVENCPSRLGRCTSPLDCGRRSRSNGHMTFSVNKIGTRWQNPSYFTLSLSLPHTLSAPRSSKRSDWLERNPMSRGRGWVDGERGGAVTGPLVDARAHRWVVARRRAVFQRNTTFAACRSACDRIHGSGLPTSVRSSPTGREGSAASTAADQVSPATLRRRWVCSSSSSSKTRIPSYSLRVRVRGQTSALVSLIGC